MHYNTSPSYKLKEKILRLKLAVNINTNFKYDNILRIPYLLTLGSEMLSGVITHSSNHSLTFVVAGFTLLRTFFSGKYCNRELSD
jgi:hypothetical protein